MPIDTAKLNEFALGILGEEDMTAIQHEIDASASLQKQLASIQHALLQVAQSEQPLKTSARLKQTVLNAILEKTRFDGFIERFAELFDLDKRTAKNLLAKLIIVRTVIGKQQFFPALN